MLQIFLPAIGVTFLFLLIIGIMRLYPHQWDDGLRGVAKGLLVLYLPSIIDVTLSTYFECGNLQVIFSLFGAFFVYAILSVFWKQYEYSRLSLSIGISKLFYLFFLLIFKYNHLSIETTKGVLFTMLLWVISTGVYFLANNKIKIWLKKDLPDGNFMNFD